RRPGATAAGNGGRSCPSSSRAPQQVVPGDAGLEDEPDAGEALAIVPGLAAGEAKAARRRGPQGLKAFPQGIGPQGSHGASSSSSTNSPGITTMQLLPHVLHFFRTL